jgi:hypothetical protein
MQELEPVIDTIEKIVLSSRTMLKASPSLRPGQQMMDGCIAKHPESIAIRNAWAFHEPVTNLPAKRYDEMVNRGSQVVFHG